ncbi:MAG TPA: T9SS type A sorting domain-containing protein [Edaphocola sp.]|nr:T9SS type A sorting domain-containing protein [Edaphocola sp.]
MKKILLTLSVALIGLTGKSFAQEADLQAFVFSDSAVASWIDVLNDTSRGLSNPVWEMKHGQQFSPEQGWNRSVTTDSIFGRWGSWNNGPDPLDPGSQIAFINSLSRFLTEQECIDNNVTCSDTERYFWTYLSGASSAAIEAGSYANLSSYKGVDTIGLLVDWNLWVDSGKAVFLGSPWDAAYQDNKDYGFFNRVYGVGSSTSPTNIDLNTRNNIYVQKMRFVGTHIPTSSIKPVSRDIESLNVYPNPANSDINFTYNFKQNSVGDLVIKDLTGKTVKIQNYGRQAAGTHTYKVDISSLANGNYILEFQTGETIAVSKFTINK